jgi:hypothetical protein
MGNNEEATMDADLRSRVVALEHRSAASDQRLTNLEGWKQLSDIADAKKDEQWKSLLEKFGVMDRKMDDLTGTLKWVNKLIIGGLIAGVVGFMIKGGFHIPG